MKRFRYTIHNVIGHPLMEIFSILGMDDLAAWIHDVTLPNGWRIDYENSWDVGEKTNQD